MGVPSASNSPSALSAQALRARALRRTLATECGDHIDFKVQQLQDLDEDTWLEVLSAPRAGKVLAQFANSREKLWCQEQEMEAYYCSGGGVISQIPNLGADVAHLSPQSGTWQPGPKILPFCHSEWGAVSDLGGSFHTLIFRCFVLIPSLCLLSASFLPLC